MAKSPQTALKAAGAVIVLLLAVAGFFAQRAIATNDADHTGIGANVTANTESITAVKVLSAAQGATLTAVKETGLRTEAKVDEVLKRLTP